jgi:uncharacterized Zn-binding protein involved in type VI secretion
MSTAYPFDPKVLAAMQARGETIPPPPEPPKIAAPAPGGGLPAARLGDQTVHFGMIGPVVTGVAAGVIFSGQPAACMGDPHVCPMFDGPKPHVGGTIVQGSTSVLIANKPAARVSDPTECLGPPGMIAVGDLTVLIGN